MSDFSPIQMAMFEYIEYFNRVNVGIDAGVPWRLIPYWIRQILIAPHKRHADRFVVWRFLYFNGYPPEFATLLVSWWAKWHSNEFVTNNLRDLLRDLQALERLATLPYGHLARKRLDQGMYYDVQLGRMTKTEI